MKIWRFIIIVSVMTRLPIRIVLIASAVGTEHGSIMIQKCIHCNILASGVVQIIYLRLVKHLQNFYDAYSEEGLVTISFGYIGQFKILQEVMSFQGNALLGDDLKILLFQGRKEGMCDCKIRVLSNKIEVTLSCLKSRYSHKFLIMFRY